MKERLFEKVVTYKREADSMKILSGILIYVWSLSCFILTIAIIISQSNMKFLWIAVLATILTLSGISFIIGLVVFVEGLPHNKKILWKEVSK